MSVKKQEKVTEISKPFSVDTIVPDKESGDFMRYVIESKSTINDLHEQLSQHRKDRKGDLHPIKGYDGIDIEPKMNPMGISDVIMRVKSLIGKETTMGKVKESKILQLWGITMLDMYQMFFVNSKLYGMRRDMTLFKNLAMTVGNYSYFNMTRAEAGGTRDGVFKPLKREESVRLDSGEEKLGLVQRFGSAVNRNKN